MVLFKKPFQVKMNTLINEIDYKSEYLNTLLYEIIKRTENDDSKTGARLYTCLKNLRKNLHEAIPAAREVAGFACQYDYSQQIQGNGYRSYVQLFIRSLTFTIQECTAVRDKRLMWRLSKILRARNIECWSRAFAALSIICRMLVIIHTHSENDCLIPTENTSLFQNLEKIKKLDISGFHGHISGFQYTPSIRPFMLFWCILLTTFSEVSSAGITNSSYTPSFINSMKYLFDEQARAKRIVALFSRGTVAFFQDFLSIANNWFVAQFCSLTQPSLSVNIQFSLLPATLELRPQDGGVLVTPPSSHLGRRPLSCRLLCGRLRHGMAGNGRHKLRFAQSQSLVIYIHGGGFVATQSKNFEMYLKYWTFKLDVPVFCIDYSLAPEAKYPRQLEECFYAYCWALKNANLLGTTANRICLSGDSAGGNLALGVALKCIQHGVRLPSGLLLIYTPLVLDMSLCPSRLFSLLDPIIPFGLLFKCFKAYLGTPAGQLPVLLNDLVYVDKDEVEQMKTLSETKSPKKYLKNEVVRQESIRPSSGRPSTLICTARRAAQTFISYLTNFLSSKRSRRYSLLPVESADVVDRRSDNASMDHNDGRGIKMSDESMNMSVTKQMYGNTVVEDFHDCSISPDFYLSPYYATTEVLRQLPRISLMTTDQDPFLDDNVAFAKKLKDCGGDVDLEILEGLPHAFLISVLASKDAMKGSRKAITSIRNILESEKR